jgi:hypothetical protein
LIWRGSPLFAVGARSERFRRTAPLCGSHSLQCHKPADVIGEILQTDLGFRSDNTDRPDNTTTRRRLLSGLHPVPKTPSYTESH